MSVTSVYLVWTGTYSDKMVHSAWSDRETAERVATTLARVYQYRNEDPRVEELEVDSQPTPRARLLYEAHLLGNDPEKPTIDVDEEPDWLVDDLAELATEVHWQRPLFGTWPEAHWFGVAYHEDRETARKILSDAVAAYRQSEVGSWLLGQGPS